MPLNDKLEKIDRLQAEIIAQGELAADVKQRLDDKIRLELNYHSNRIEGNSLDYGDTRLLLLRNLTAEGKPLKDHLEMKGHDEALRKLEELARKDIKITENLIKEFHQILLIDPFKEHQELLPGDYKNRENYLYNYEGERVDFLPAEEVPKALNELINWTNNAIDVPKARKKKYRREQYDIHPVVVAAEFHLRFVNIHPFVDGNGRMARIFMNLILMQCGFPPVIIRNETREDYYRALEISRQKKNQRFHEYIADQAILALEFYLSVAKGGPVEEADDWEKQLALLKKQANEKKEVAAKSEELLAHRMEDSLLLLLERLEPKMKQFDELFAEAEHKMELNTDKSTPGDLTVLDKLLFLRKKGKLCTINKLQMSFSWEGYRGIVKNTFSMRARVEINLTNKFEYEIKGDHDPSIKPIYKLYTEALTDEEISTFIQQQGKALVERLEKRIAENQ